MQTIKSFFTAVATALLVVTASGCAFTQPPKTVYKTETVYYEVPEQLTANVVPQRPVTKEEYLRMAIYERESYMADYATQNLKALHKCNAQLSSIAELSKRWKESVNADKQKD